MPDELRGQTVDDAAFLSVLKEAVTALDRHDIEYAAMGGVASAAVGRPRWTHDIDLFVRTDEAREALSALGDAGFATQETNPHWLFKAVKDGVLVDVIFKARGDIYLDDEMLARSQTRVFKDVQLRVLPPEDQLVIKAVVHDEETPRHWHDALGLLAAADFDWDYLARRASYGAQRVLSLLLYARSVDLVVPDRVLRALFDRICPPPREVGQHG